MKKNTKSSKKVTPKKVTKLPLILQAEDFQHRWIEIGNEMWPHFKAGHAVTVWVVTPESN